MPMKILDSELPRNARGVASKRGWRVHPKAGRDIPDDAPGCKKRRRRKDMEFSNKLSVCSGSLGLGGSSGGWGGWIDGRVWMADVWRECVEMEEPEEVV